MLRSGVGSQAAGSQTTLNSITSDQSSNFVSDSDEENLGMEKHFSAIKDFRY